MIAPYSFTMEKVLFVVRLLKERLVINLGILLLHGPSKTKRKEEMLRESELVIGNRGGDRKDSRKV